MYYIIHIATAYQSFRSQAPEIQELIWTRTQRHLHLKEPDHPILSATLDEYLTKSKEAADITLITSALKTKMALTPEFGHVIAIPRAIVLNGQKPKARIDVAGTPHDEKALLQTFWDNLGKLIENRGIPTFVTWNGLEFTFPFLTERSASLGVEPTCVLPRARFQPRRHLDLLAELADYNPSRYMSLRSRLALWGLTLNGNGKESGFESPETLIEQWRRGNSALLEENLKLTLHAIHQILNKTSPFLFRTGHNGERHLPQISPA